MDSNLTGMWVSFFATAGIPSDVSATYALTFTENRIQSDMLLDLNKEYLRDMGITRMGDVIAILRHAKQVHETAARDKVLNTAASVNKVPVAAVTGRATITQNKPSSPASRILEHYTRNPLPQETSPVSSQKRKSDEMSSDNAVNLKKTRLIRFSSPTPVALTNKESAINKDTVFSRLGNTEVKPNPQATGKPVFSRLGAKSEQQVKIAPKQIPIEKDALKYEGILKSTVAAKKIVTVTTSKNNVRKICMGGTMRADQTPLSVKEKLAIIPKAKSVKFSNHIEYKEIEGNKKQKEKIVTEKFTPVFNKPERRLSMPQTINAGVKSRLGVTKNENNITITKNVFNRLGV